MSIRKTLELTKSLVHSNERDVEGLLCCVCCNLKHLKDWEEERNVLKPVSMSVYTRRLHIKLMLNLGRVLHLRGTIGWERTFCSLLFYRIFYNFTPKFISEENYDVTSRGTWVTLVLIVIGKLGTVPKGLGRIEKSPGGLSRFPTTQSTVKGY